MFIVDMPVVPSKPWLLLLTSLKSSMNLLLPVGFDVGYIISVTLNLLLSSDVRSSEASLLKAFFGEAEVSLAGE
jgi:hypothetical protein